MSKHSQLSPLFGFVGFIGLTSALALTACSPKISAGDIPNFLPNTSAGDNGSKNSATPAALALDGQWASACKPNTSNDGTFQATVYTFNGANFQSASNVYTDSGCTNQEISMSMSGTYKVSGAAATPSGVANAQAENVDVTLVGDNGETMTIYTVFELDGGNQLYTVDGSQDAGSRPAMADHSTVFTRVPTKSRSQR